MRVLAGTIIPWLIWVAFQAAGAMAQTLYVPAAAHIEGVNHTRWRTDLQVKAHGGEAATFVVELLQRDADNTEPLAIERNLGPGESLRMTDILETGFGLTGAGALRIRATSGRILVSSRTYNDDPDGSYGQAVPSVAEDQATGSPHHVALIQLSRSPDLETGFRTNIGLVNVSGVPITIEIGLYLADGTFIGSLTADLLPFGFHQVNDIFHLAGEDAVADGYAIVGTGTEGGRFIAYASVVDNRSGDAVFLLGQPDVVAPEPPPAQERLVVFESFVRPG